MPSKTPQSSVLHKVAHITLAALYASAYAGIDKTILYVLVAAVYLLLSAE